MANLDGYLAHLSSQDTKKKLQIGADILNYLSIEDNSLECDNLSVFIDSIIHWLNNSNFKVAQNGLEILAQIATRMRDDFKPYLSSVLMPTIDRMGDSRDCVREQAKALLMRLMNFVSTPQNILEKLMPAFSHKIWRVREEICFFFQDALIRYGVVGSTNGQLYVSKFIPPLVILLSDPNLQVRDSSMTTLIEIYKHVGDKLRNEILRKHSNMPHQKLQSLLSKFDDIANTGEVVSSTNNNYSSNSPAVNNTNNKFGSRGRVNAATLSSTNSTNSSDEVDFKKSAAFKRATSAPPVKRATSVPKYAASNMTKPTGAADEEMFMNTFEDVPRIQIFSAKDFEQELNRFKEVCSDPNTEWEKRVEGLRKFRSLLIAGATDYDEFYTFLKPLELPFQISVKDLRSQVVREACISIAYLSQRIENKCDRFAEALLPTLINLIQNCAKIMSSSSIVAIRFIIQHTHANRLIPIITYNISSKSKEIRKACCEFLDQLLHTWSTHTLEKHVGTLQEAIKKGISDADPEARSFARKAFWGFADKFKAESDYLLSSLDSSKQKMLHGEQMSNWSSTNSLNKATSYNSRPQTVRTNSVSTNGSMESINRHLTSFKRSAIPVSSPKPNPSTFRTPVRANSAIDVDAQRRARAKANSYLNHPKVMLNSVHTLSRPTPKKAESTISYDERSSRKNRVSKSQPGSRSASPSSRLSYYSNIPSGDSRTRARRKLSTASREQSPNRTPAYERRLSSSSSASRHRNYMMNSDLDLSNKPILHHNDEELLENAFMLHGTPRKKCYDDQSDESETSSICSDISFANYGVRKMEDVNKILENLSSTNWSDRKDGLMSLATFLRQSDRALNSFELKRITDIFTKMLVDPHTKAFSLFLTILNELIQNYKLELNSWLYILMTRLFLKVGSDTLGSIQTRILKTFELIRESFSIDHQFNVIMRLLSDQTQTLNTKVKIAILQYLSKLIFIMDSSDFVFNRINNHEIQTSLMKIISWTADIKSSDLRKISQETIVDLYNLNSAEMTLYINGLPKTYQDAAQQIIQHKRKTRPNQSPGAVMQTPYKIKSLYTTNKANKYFDETENLNPDEIYDSLKKTSDEIQKYSFSIDSESLTPTNNFNNVNSYTNSMQKSANKKIDNLSSASLDSGISQIDGIKSLLVSNSAHFNDTPNNRGAVILKTSNNLPQNNHVVATSPKTNGHSSNDHNLALFVNRFMSNSVDSGTFHHYLSEIIQYIQESNYNDILVKCDDIYKHLWSKFADETSNQNKVLILRAIGQILLKNCFEEQVEPTLLKLLEVSKDSDKDVVKASEETSYYAVSCFDAAKCFQILKPYINHKDSALNIAAIKMLTKMVEFKKKEFVIELLPEMMPVLLQAYDNTESAVRKATVFCMVAIYGAVGDEMNSHLMSLSGSKMKLLKLYIDRSIQTNNKN